ncbi:MAG: lactate utilization protein [Firmicutes bacterium HGW-Firmicutes-1]|jgi:L-lactate utilization protein LutB|nr:MAG: lactate utilization protein [Firmicutes bacterium HGW-Firmicutes-1]
MTPKDHFYQIQAESIIKKLEQRNMAGYYCKTSEEAKNLALDLMKSPSVISWGGSQTITEIGLLDELKNHNYTLIDRRQANSPEEVREAYLKAFEADYYLMSSNAITLDGELINIDGNGNRVAALIYGPRNVIIIAGMNKIVSNEETAVARVRNFATPPNALRLNQDTPCSKTGKCHDCTHEQCLCCQIVTTRFSRVSKRIKVILVGETLGF